MQILHGRFSLQVGRVSSAGSETRPTIDVVKNETILCSAVCMSISFTVEHFNNGILLICSMYHRICFIVVLFHSVYVLRAFSGFGAISRLPMNIFRILKPNGWAVSGFWAISRWAKGVFRILKRPSPFQDLEIAQDIFEIAQGHFYD